MTVRASVLGKMNIHMSKKWPEMVVEPYMCSHFYIESEYRGPKRPSKSDISLRFETNPELSNEILGCRI